uniref:Uncharacterized protein n=1 Tax=Arundo donax TaxID=35708 RepID=A0A0A9H4Q1_ARUDO
MMVDGIHSFHTNYQEKLIPLCLHRKLMLGSNFCGDNKLHFTCHYTLG